VTGTLHSHRTSTTGELRRVFVSGDEQALDEMRRRHHRVPVAAARRQALSTADVEHVVQETWRRFERCAADIDGPDDVVGWPWATASSIARATHRCGGVVGEACAPSADGPADETRRYYGGDFARHDNRTLVVLAQRGSDRAFESLVRRLDSVVAALAHRYGLSSADAADVAQLTFLQLNRYLSVLREPERVVGSVATTARRECLRIAATRRDEPFDPIALDRDLARHEVDASVGAMAKERVTLVNDALRKVPERSRKLLQLLIWEER
jgi:DNA-directed RNA polymerase specialized sigma24 family protein